MYIFYYFYELFTLDLFYPFIYFHYDFTYLYLLYKYLNHNSFLFEFVTLILAPKCRDFSLFANEQTPW